MLLLLIASLSVAPVTLACQPLAGKFRADSNARVKSDVDDATFVVTATVVKVEKVALSSHGLSDFKMAGKRTPFRVNKVFEGKLASGVTFNLESGYSSSARSVLIQAWEPGLATPTT